MASTKSVCTVRKVTVVTSASRHSTRRLHRNTVTQYNHIVLITLCLVQVSMSQDRYTYSSVVKLWFTLRALASAAGPELVQVVKIN